MSVLMIMHYVTKTGLELWNDVKKCQWWGRKNLFIQKHRLLYVFIYRKILRKQRDVFQTVGISGRQSRRFCTFYLPSTEGQVRILQDTKAKCGGTWPIIQHSQGWSKRMSSLRPAMTMIVTPCHKQTCTKEKTTWVTLPAKKQKEGRKVVNKDIVYINNVTD
jgi:hypothetical protein